MFFLKMSIDEYLVIHMIVFGDKYDDDLIMTMNSYMQNDNDFDDERMYEK